eukprot:TRINITY_DN55949_c0_g1_i1.p1 TRINITY_DN55949_c0_g1~~TRINITY_DN55949_c0_g1_i1.p1  ORF type:complete len:576 (-),score=119.13 TRINITY_DN55949_c0_g1_i1:356-2083(-)
MAVAASVAATVRHARRHAGYAVRTVCRQRFAAASTLQPAALITPPRGFCTATASGDGSVGSTGSALGTMSAGEAAKDAFSKFGKYQGNEVAWDKWTERFLADIERLDIQTFKTVANLLAHDVKLTRASVWDRLAEKASMALAQASLDELMELTRAHTRIRAFNRDVFMATIDKVSKEGALQEMTPAQLTELLDIFSCAGQTVDLSRRSKQMLIAAMQDCVLDDLSESGDLDEPDQFSTDECISLVQSMARLRVTELRHVLQELGRHKLHVNLADMSADRLAALGHAYGQLGYRHDTFFKTVVEQILAEIERMQRDVVLGLTVGEPTFTANEIALVSLALLRNKMNKGNTTWCKWQANYTELMDVLQNRVVKDIDKMNATSLSAASFVLGRARRGTEELHKMMYERMMRLLEQADADAGAADSGVFTGYAASGPEPPQYELAQFMQGLTMMGPNRQKPHLDTFWLQQWLCTHVHTMTLSDFILVNRQLVMLNCFEGDYLKMLVEQFYTATSEAMGESPISRMTKTDVQELTHTYNKAELRESQIGRHFWWAIGKRWQEIHAAQKRTTKRPQFRRLG